jgi:hypothetical protein
LPEIYYTMLSPHHIALITKRDLPLTQYAVYKCDHCKIKADAKVSAFNIEIFC